MATRTVLYIAILFLGFPSACDAQAEDSTVNNIIIKRTWRHRVGDLIRKEIDVKLKETPDGIDEKRWRSDWTVVMNECDRVELEIEDNVELRNDKGTLSWGFQNRDKPAARIVMPIAGDHLDGGAASSGDRPPPRITVRVAKPEIENGNRGEGVRKKLVVVVEWRARPGHEIDAGEGIKITDFAFGGVVVPYSAGPVRK